MRRTIARYPVGPGAVTRWSVAMLQMPAPLGYLVRLEDGPLFRGPATWLGLSWWWRPTLRSALRKALVEIEKFEAAQ